MKNPIRRMHENFSSFMNNDQMKPFVKYGVAPTTYMATNPRYDKRPETQATPSSQMNSRMAPNVQAGEMLSGRVPAQTSEQIYAQEVEEFAHTPNTGFYRRDPRIQDVDAERGKSDFQDKPTRSAILGHPIVPQIGFEGIIAPDTMGAYDRQSGEVNSPAVFGDAMAYQGSLDQYSTSPMWLLGGSNYGPRPSQFYVKDELEDDSAHPNQEWTQTHRNAVQHTIGHEHPYSHRDSHVKVVKFHVGRTVPGAPQ